MGITNFVFTLVTVIIFTVAGITSGMAASDTKTASAATTITTTKQGLVISAPGMGSYTLGYPIIEGEKITDCQLDGGKATVTYDGGTKLDAQIDDKGVVTYHYSNLPSGVKKVEMDMPLPASLAKGGSFRINDGNAIRFPETTPANTYLYADNQVFRLGVHDADQNSFVLYMPGQSYLEVSDLRGLSTGPGGFVVRVISQAVPDMTLRLGDPAPRHTAANHELLSILRAPKTMVIDGKTDQWAGIPAQEIPSSRLTDGDFNPGKPTEPSDPISATFQTCWDNKYLYLLVTVTDPSPMHNINPSREKLWCGDGVEVFFGGDHLDLGGDLLLTDVQIILGADQVAGSIVHVSGMAEMQPFKSVVVPSKGGYILEAAIPFKVLGFAPAEGRQFRLDIGVNDSAGGKDRRCQLMWNGTNLNSLNRTNWGRAVLSH